MIDIYITQFIEHICVAIFETYLASEIVVWTRNILIGGIRKFCSIEY